jgi:hypothetical protein
MELDPSHFYPLNVVDTCAVWHLLSSKKLYETALAVGCMFSCTAFVAYECLTKPRTKKATPAQEVAQKELQRRLQREQEHGRFTCYHLDLDELLDVEIMEKRKNLGKGELSSIAFAKRTRQAFHTDDQKARKLASHVMETGRVQTTPHLWGWLYFTQALGDADKDDIISEHEHFEGPLRSHFEIMYMRALQYRLRANSGQYPILTSSGHP